jgi:hypothetical protein
MKLFGRRWDRWDGIVAAAAVILIVVSRQPWYTVHEEGSVTVWNASTHWELSQAVTLGLVAAGIHLAYTARPNAQGAAWMAALMLLGGLGLIGWHWQHPGLPSGKLVVSVGPGAYSGETPEQYRRRSDEEIATRMAQPDFFPTRSSPQRGFYTGAASLLALGVTVVRTIARSEARRTQAD